MQIKYYTILHEIAERILVIQMNLNFRREKNLFLCELIRFAEQRDEVFD